MGELVFLMLFFYRPARASVSEYMDLVGKIQSFDEKAVRVQSGNVLWTVPREKIVLPRIVAQQEIRVHLKRTDLANMPHEKVSH